LARARGGVEIEFRTVHKAVALLGVSDGQK